MHEAIAGAARSNLNHLSHTHAVAGDVAKDARAGLRQVAVRRGAVELAVRQADALAMSVSGALDRISVPLSRAATALVRDQSWFELGFARLEDYSRERFGRSGRWVRDLAGLGEAVDRLPLLAAALAGEDGGRPVGLVAAMLIGRVASSKSLAAWVELARRVTVRELRDEVRQARANGSACPSGGRPGLQGSPAPGVSLPESAPAAASSSGMAYDDATPDVDDDSPGELVRMLVPWPVRAAFDEALELFRAVEGHNSSVASFIEALVAETASGPDGIEGGDDIDRAPLCASARRAVTEAALCHATSHWRHLAARLSSSWALALAGAGMGRFEQLCAQAGRGDAVALDSQIRELLEFDDHLQRRLGDLLSEMSRLGAWWRLGFDGCSHYAEQRLGLSRSSASQRLQAARLLRRLPLVWRAYEQGEIGLEPALHIYRMVGGAGGARAGGSAAGTAAGSPGMDALQERWLALARSATVKRMRDEVRLWGRRGSDETALPGGPFDPSGPFPPCDDASWHASLHREPGLARARVARWGHAVADQLERGAGNRASVPDVFLRLRLSADLASSLLASVCARRRRLELQAGAMPDDLVPAASVRAARHFCVRGRRAPAWVGLLAMLEEFVSVWDAGKRSRGDDVYVRDGYRCSAPGCFSRRNLEDHHIVYRSRGGNDDLGNRTCLCRFHHQRGEHGGLASCRGIAPLGIVWQLGRQGIGGKFRNERRMG